MPDNPRERLEYATPMPARKRPAILKWLLFALAAIFSLLSLDVAFDARGAMAGNSAGGAAAGLWIAFAILHVHQDRLG